MSREQNQKSKIITGLAVFGLLMGLSVPRANAQLTAKSYSGRYACTSQEEVDDATAIYKYGPNGGGAYNGGTLVASATTFTSFPTISPTSDFCMYTLDLAGSSYFIGADGTGFEVLVWNSTGTNNTTLGCPSTFTDQTAIGLRNELTVDGNTIRAEFIDVNLLAEDEPGYGHCLK